MNYMKDVLYEMRNRPIVYLGKNEIEYLYAYINGYMYRLFQEEDTIPEFYPGFQMCIRDRVIVYSAMGIPMSFFVMTSYYATISTALEESAYIDGATFLQTFFGIILPLAKPGLVTVALLQFINTWNEFYFALMLTSGDTARTVPIALNYYMGTFANNYSALFAAVVMTVLPTIVLFIILQRQVMESLTEGAVKG